MQSNSSNNKMEKDEEEEISRDEMLQSFLTDDGLNDVTLVGTDGDKVPANRYLLSARSKVFRSLLLGKFREASSPIVELGFPGSVLRAVVEYIYTDAAQMVHTTKKRKINTMISQSDGHGSNGGNFDFQSIQLLMSLVEAASYFHLPNLSKSVQKKFDQIWETSPCCSFGILQACHMAGPRIPSALLEKAITHVHSTPTESILQQHVDCLSANVLEQVLQDSKMQMTEYQLFQILVLWSSSGGQNDRRAVASELTRHISLEKIDPSDLATAVTASGLVTSEQLLEAYKYQAFELKKVSATNAGGGGSTLINQFRCNRWVTEIPSTHCPTEGGDGCNCYPTEIKIEGAGAAVVNGVYVQEGSFRGSCKYIKQGTFAGKSSVFWIFATSHCWYVSIPDLHKPGSFRDTDFYKIQKQANVHLPPTSEWEVCDQGLQPAPRLLYKFSTS